MQSTLTKNSTNKLINSLPKAIANCSTQATAYGKCIGLTYSDVNKNACQIPFEAFKTCVVKFMKK